jgi:hypothetical protein
MPHPECPRYLSPIDSNVGVFISYGGTMHVTSDRFITFSTKPNLGLKKCAHRACTPPPVLSCISVSGPLSTDALQAHDASHRAALVAGHEPQPRAAHDAGPRRHVEEHRQQSVRLALPAIFFCNTLSRYDFAWGRSAGEGWSKDSIIAAVRHSKPHSGYNFFLTPAARFLKTTRRHPSKRSSRRLCHCARAVRAAVACLTLPSGTSLRISSPTGKYSCLTATTSSSRTTICSPPPSTPTKRLRSPCACLSTPPPWSPAASPTG